MIRYTISTLSFNFTFFMMSVLTLLTDKVTIITFIRVL